MVLIQQQDSSCCVNHFSPDVTSDVTPVSRASLDSLRAVVESAKDSRVAALRPMVLAAEENLHSMTVDLDRAVDKVCPPPIEFT